MALFSKWTEKRRQRELEHINREIELLKKKGLDYERESERRDQLLEKGEHGNQKVTKDANFKLLFMICLCLLVIAGITLFYRHNLSTLKTDYTHKLQEVEELTKELSNKSATLGELSSRLDTSKRAEGDLSQQYLDLQAEKETLTKQVNLLNDNLKKMNSDIEQVKSDLDKKDKEVEDLKQCITQELDKSLSLCGY